MKEKKFLNSICNFDKLYIKGLKWYILHRDLEELNNFITSDRNYSLNEIKKLYNSFNNFISTSNDDVKFFSNKCRNNLIDIQQKDIKFYFNFILTKLSKRDSFESKDNYDIKPFKYFLSFVSNYKNKNKENKKKGKTQDYEQEK